jgi:hypothetical protein
VHQKRIQATAASTSQVTETVSKSVKVWRVKDVRPDGRATIENLVENVQMRNRFSDGRDLRYNSLTDREPPPAFQDLAESIGVPLAEVTMNARGAILSRRRKPVRAGAQNREGLMTIPFPEEAVPIGQAWSFRHTVNLPLPDGTVRKVKILQTFKLRSVEQGPIAGGDTEDASLGGPPRPTPRSRLVQTGVATIDVATKILTPIHNPVLEAKLIDRESTGTVRFDVGAGRVLHQQVDVDRRVIGFVPNNPASCLHYRTRFTETLLPEEPKTAGRAGSRAETSRG